MRNKSIISKDRLWVIGDRIRASRDALGLTQEEFAEKLSVTRETVGQWERGKSSPSFDAVIRICELCQCDADFIMGRIDCKTHDMQFIHDQTGLSEYAIKKLMQFKHKNKADAKADIVSILIEHFNAEYLIDLIGQRISTPTVAPKDSQPMTPKELSAYANSTTLRVNIDGRQILVNKSNFLDSQISTAVIRDLPEIVAAYNQQHDKTPVERADAFNDFRDDLIRQIETDRRAGTLDVNDETSYIRAAIDEYLRS